MYTAIGAKTNNQWTTPPRPRCRCYVSQPLCMTHLTQHQASSVALGWPGRWCHTNKGTPQRLHPSQREEGSGPTVTTKLPPWQKIGVTNEIQALHSLYPLSWSSNNITSRHQMSASYYLTAIFNSYIRVTRPFLSLQRVLLARLARILVSESWEGAHHPTWVVCCEELVYTLNKVLGKGRTSSSDQTPFHLLLMQLQSLPPPVFDRSQHDWRRWRPWNKPHGAHSLVLYDEGLVWWPVFHRVQKLSCTEHRIDRKLHNHNNQSML